MQNFRELKDGPRHARCWGWEAQANDLTFYECQDDIAHYYGKTWAEMTPEEKLESKREFDNGREEEKANS